MHNCKEITRLVSESLDRKLPLHQRMGIRVHLLMCKFCSRYKKQLLILREAMRLQERYLEDTGASITLSSEARERIKRSFIASLNKSQ
ncbi:MAG: zf-HC2 domain-containing protein [Thermodesulfobacteriota bacterium]|nr:zf-HC2 domain-containing protein [Thermodesulfobacteriota bacterium]